MNFEQLSIRKTERKEDRVWSLQRERVCVLNHVETVEQSLQGVCKSVEVYAMYLKCHQWTEVAMGSWTG